MTVPKQIRVLVLLLLLPLVILAFRDHDPRTVVGLYPHNADGSEEAQARPSQFGSPEILCRSNCSQQRREGLRCQDWISFLELEQVGVPRDQIRRVGDEET